MTQPIPDELQKWADKNITDGVEQLTEEIMSTHPFKVEDYEPKFPREGLEHRVLGTITDEEHYEGKQMNTLDQVSRFLVSDPVVPVDNPDAVGAAVDKLHEAGLVEHRDDGSYVLTRDGWIELIN